MINTKVDKTLSKEIALALISIIALPVFIIVILMATQVSSYNALQEVVISRNNDLLQSVNKTVTTYIDSKEIRNIEDIHKDVWINIIEPFENGGFIISNSDDDILFISNEDLFKIYDLDQLHSGEANIWFNNTQYTINYSNIMSSNLNIGRITMLAPENNSMNNKNYQTFIILGLLIASIIIYKRLYGVTNTIVLKYTNIAENYKKADVERQVYLDKYLKSEKLLTMSRFASGIAHEIGNPLSSIISSVQILQQYKLTDDQLSEYHGKILYDAEKIDLLLKEFLDFRRYNDDMKINININKLITEITEGIKSYQDYENIELHLDLYRGINECNLDANRIKMVLSNIIHNAYQAIEGSGYIHIRTLNVDNYIRIRVRDSGKGIEKDIIEKIFDPFFTTKNVGDGYGLGLFITMQIVHAHQGNLTVESNVGEGTIFTIDLPIQNILKDE